MHDKTLSERFSDSVWSMPLLLPRVNPGLAAATAVAALVTVAVPIALMLDIGYAVGLAPDFAGGGPRASLGSSLGVAILLAGLLILANQLASSLLAALSESLGRQFNSHLRGRVIARITSVDSQRLVETDEVQNLVAVARGLRGGYAGPMGLVVGLVHKATLVLTGVAAAVVLLVVSPVAAAIVVPIDILAGAWMRRRLQSALSMLYFDPRILRRSAYLHRLLVERESAKEIRAFGLAEWLGRWSDAEWLSAMRGVWADRRLPRVATATAVVLVGMAHAVALAVIAHEGATGGLRPGGMIIAIQAVLGAFALALTSPWDELVQAGHEAISAAVRLEQIAEPAGPEPTAALPADPPRRGVSIEGLEFSYASGEPVLRGLDLEFAPGRSYALVGHNGSGKSTVLKLLLGLYEPDAGSIRVEGLDLREVDRAEWRRRCAVVFQDFLRLGVSARDSVEFGAWDRRDGADALAVAADKAGLTPVVSELPEGWDTILSPQVRGGADLSGGQWQRVAIARALYAMDRGASLLALDEPTANLDAESERRVYEAILSAAKGQSLILVSHRFSTVRHVDHIYVMDQGRVIEQGDHAALLAQGGMYANMFRAQSEMVTGG